MLRNNKNKQIPSYEFMLLDYDKYTFLLFLYTVLYQHAYTVQCIHASFNIISNWILQTRGLSAMSATIYMYI